MYSKLTCILLIISSFSHEALSNKIGYYTVITPGTIRSESFFHVSITLNNFHQSCWFSISLTNFNQTIKLYGYESIEIQPRTTQLVKLRAPYLTDKLGHLEVFGYRGIASRDSALINFEANSYSTFIQTNKAKFKPGELVEFRVICIDKFTRPAKVNHKIFVKIYDGQDNLLKLVCNVKLVQGVFRSKFQLSDNPVLGEWRVKVEIDGDDVAEKSLEVARYVLPRFYVEIKTNPNVAIDEGKITLEIISRNFYGEPVQGSLTISLKKIYAYFQEENLPKLIKTSQINGNRTITFDIANDLHLKNKILDQRSMILYKVNVEAYLIDELTEQQSGAEVEISIHSQPYKIELQVPEFFEPDKIITFKMKVLVTDLQDNPIQDSLHPIKILLNCKNRNNSRFKSEQMYQLGFDDVLIKITNEHFSICYIQAKYRGRKSSVKRVKENSNLLYLDILTQSPEEGKELEISLRSLNPIGNIAYEIISRGDILQSKLVNVPENQTSYMLRFNVTWLMVPKITIYIHGIENRYFMGQCSDIYIKGALKNSITIATNEESKPGSSVQINVTADEGSYVGLMALDHRILQGTHVEDNWTEDNFDRKLQNYYSISFENSKYSPGLSAGLITFTNAQMPLWVVKGWGLDDDTSRGDSGTGFLIPSKVFEKPIIMEFPYIRKLFSDSWLYKDFERTPAEGLNFMETIPDAITTWAITGFSLNSNTGLTLTREATKLKVFQKFLISMDLPVLVREGEIIEIPIYIRHYMSQEVWTNLTIKSDSEDLEVLVHPEATSNAKKNISKLILANKLEKNIIYLKPCKPGQYNVMVKAVSTEASDAIQKTLNVQSQGKTYTMSKTYLVHLPEEDIQEDEITIDIPKNAVPESQRIDISVVGDVFRPLLRSLQKMERIPYGNGRDNMKYTISNLLVLKYLKALNYSKPGLESKLKLNLELGYQNQLSFKHLDGSFGLFERTIKSRTGDIWQTSLAMWGLKQASDFIQIDFQVIKRGMEYLKSKQQENGCFGARNDIEEDVKITAFVLMVFLMDVYSKTTFSEVISKGLQCLYDRSESLEESFSNSIFSTYVLWLGKYERAEDRVRKLSNNSRLISKREQIFWTEPDTLESNLQTSAKGLMNLFEAQNYKLTQNTSVLQILREFLNPEAVTAPEDSSVSHMIALKELIGFVENLRFNRRKLNITFSDDHKGSGSFQVSEQNSQVLQTLKISRRSRKINIRSSGYGFGIIVVKYNYNLLCEGQYSSVFITNVTTSMLSARSLSVLEFCLSIVPSINSKNNLMIMEITLQSGYLFNEKSSLEVADNRLREKVKSIKINGSRNLAEVYFENIDNNGVCIRFKAFREYKVLNAKPGGVNVYDAYEKDVKTFKSFTIHNDI